MSVLKIVLFIIIFIVTALVIWVAPIASLLGRLVAVLIAAGLIILIH